MKGIRELRPKDLVIREVKAVNGEKLSFTVSLLIPFLEFFGDQLKTGDEFFLSGTYVPSLGEVSVLVCGNDGTEMTPMELSEEEEKLMRLSVTVHLWRQHHLLPSDYLRYLTEDGFQRYGHYEGRYDYDAGFKNAIVSLGYYYPYTSLGPKKHAGYRNGAVMDLIMTEETFLTAPERKNETDPSDLGKVKCRKMREIRKLIAEVNDIPFFPCPCHHVGLCKGNCPVCEAEIRYLEGALSEKAAGGETVRLTGLNVKSDNK